jgi:hypothetical protein
MFHPGGNNWLPRGQSSTVSAKSPSHNYHEPFETSPYLLSGSGVYRLCKFLRGFDTGVQLNYLPLLPSHNSSDRGGSCHVRLLLGSSSAFSSLISSHLTEKHVGVTLLTRLSHMPISGDVVTISLQLTLPLLLLHSHSAVALAPRCGFQFLLSSLNKNNITSLCS